MTIKRKFKLQYQVMTDFVETFRLPAWVNGLRLRLVFLGIIGILSLINVCEVSSASTSGYQMHDLETKVAAMSADIQKVNVEIADASAMNNIQKRLKDSDMVAVSEIKYIAVGDSLVAKR